MKPPQLRSGDQYGRCKWACSRNVSGTKTIKWPGECAASTGGSHAAGSHLSAARSADRGD